MVEKNEIEGTERRFPSVSCQSSRPLFAINAQTRHLSLLFVRSGPEAELPQSLLSCIASEISEVHNQYPLFAISDDKRERHEPCKTKQANTKLPMLAQEPLPAVSRAWTLRCGR